MKRACLNKTSKSMKVLRSESRDEVYFGYTESRKTTVQNEQNFWHAAYHMALVLKIKNNI